MSRKSEYAAAQPAIAAMSALCCERNAAVRKCRELGALPLCRFLDLQAEKVKRNRAIPPLRPSEDFLLSAYELTRARLGDTAAEGVAQALRYGVVSTADHHGAVIYAQSFQGDLLFDALMNRLGYQSGYLPILTAGQVELGNVTFARGMSLYTLREKKQTLPFFRMADHNRMATHTPPIDAEKIQKFRRRFLTQDTEPRTRAALDALLRMVYEADAVRKQRSFTEQVTAIGALVCEQLFAEERAPRFVYLELEALTRPLLLRELKESDSILSKLLRDRACRRKLREICFGNGVPLAARLFSAADAKGRKVFLTLQEDGTLTGVSKGGAVLSYPSDAESLCALLTRNEVFSGPFMSAFLLAFERGITWMGGMFQSLYLPDWQARLTELLRATGFAREAQRVCAYDCSGYISGPMFALSGGDGYATPAGPIELWMADADYAGLRRMMERTSLWDAHLIGLAEMVPDLLSKDERPPGWYQTIAEELYGAFAGNTLSCTGL